MKISYLDCDGKYKLFSFARHDYKQKEIDGKIYFIDGGFEEYIRSGEHGKIEQSEIKDLISEIREQFTWGQNYDEKGNRLKQTKKETIEWTKSSEGLQYKDLFFEEWKLYNKGKKLRNAPTKFKLLKDLTIGHICGILSFLNNAVFNEIDIKGEVKNNKICETIEIFIQELNYRIINKLI